MQTLQQLNSGQLRGATQLKLSCGLTEFPVELFDLADTLEYLDLSGNKLRSLPENFGSLKNLKIAFFSDNLFTEFPKQIGDCKRLEMVGFKANQIESVPENAFPESLRWLILTDNCIENLPDSIGNCVQLQKVALAGNKLKMLPDSMKNCRKIELLRISANELTEIPGWLYSLPKLSWLAFGGNPVSAEHNFNAQLPEFDWNSMQIGEKLGEGASGFIWKAKLIDDLPAKFPEEVAVKVFKGTVSSDGLPEDEMNAGIVAGAHPNLISLLGKISGHPEQKQGLVLKLIPPNYRNLGTPPSLKTCTRDTFPDGTVFTLKEVFEIATGIASAARQLHQNGCMHGDLYAHNILINDAANPLLGDFGAATVYDTSDTGRAEAIEKIEVRAFGCLLEDLLTRLADKNADQKAAQPLFELMERCLLENVLSRPFFKEIDTVLSSLKAI